MKPMGYLYLFPATFMVGLMLGAFGLLLSVHVRQMENFAGMMNFVIFPMFFISSALYPLWRLEESAVRAVHWLAMVNPFTHGVELIRFAAYERFEPVAFLVVAGCAVAFYLAAVIGYDPQRGLVHRSGGPPRGPR